MEGQPTYNPFQMDNNISENTPALLQEQCKGAILKSTTLRGVHRLSRIVNFDVFKLVTLSMSDFEKAEDSDNTKIKSFYRRPLSYRTTCRIDGNKYAMLNNDYNKFNDHGVKRQWLTIQHPHIMSVHAEVNDKWNTFYVVDEPQATLQDILFFFHANRWPIPEQYIWEIIYGLSSALLYIKEQGLPFSLSRVENVFFVNNRVVLENELTKRPSRQLFPCIQFKGEGTCESLFAEMEAVSSIHQVLTKILMTSNHLKISLVKHELIRCQCSLNDEYSVEMHQLLIMTDRDNPFRNLLKVVFNYTQKVINKMSEDKDKITNRFTLLEYTARTKIILANFGFLNP